MRELARPSEVEGDDRATEMIRVWLAHDTLCVSMLLGMYADAPDCEIDERDAWGHLLADLTRHIANGMHQSHGWSADATANRIREAFLARYEQNEPVEGKYLED